VRRDAVKELHERRTHSERGACRLVGVSRSTFRYEPEGETEEEAILRRRIRELAHRHKRYGCRRITVLLRREGWEVNKKRVHRIWKGEELQIPRRRPRKRRRGPKGEVVRKAQYRDHVWSYDFVEDSTEGGRKLRFLTVVDEFTRECLAIEAGLSFGAREVIECLEWLYLTRSVPEYIRSDNGPELVAKALQKWLQEKGCKTIYIKPGSPWENPYIESFNGKFRDECLNMEVFRNVREAQVVVQEWRKEYNEFRPHSALGNLTPAEFAASSVSSASPTASLRLQNSNPLIVVGT
jgi:putative transposase